MKTAVKLAYVVPTKDRPDDLGKLLESIRRQTRMPDQLIIVDGSAPDVRHVVDRFADLPITYVREMPPSLARQRNAGMAALSDDITVAGYLDDDIVMEPDATEKMLEFWEDAATDVGGAAFSIINQPQIIRESVLKFFLMHGSKPGKVMPSGFAAFIPYVTKTIQTEWLYGGATVWRREVIDEISFDEWYDGYGYLEDLDYSYRVSRRWKLFVTGDARVWHFSGQKSLDKQYELGRQQTFNRIYFVRKMKTFSRLATAWALSGLVFMALLAFLRYRDRPRYRRIVGNLHGIVAALSGREKSFAGHWK
ncbi:MAG TPA: glycosyltransferase [Rhodospirillaceae bacterium]|nr:glycosyltransferase [Magnetovibrio sp.]HBT41713.1 glycosyltransferase [Rhodospirillaceae bacterium]HCS70949.1 glycosyltransferase [Rhodospirillaceae bacterium]